MAIHIKKSHEGRLTRKASAAGQSPIAFAHKVLAAQEGKYSPATRKQANFAANAAKWHHGKRK